MKEEKKPKKLEYIYRRYIIRNGIKIYPKNAKVFKIPVRN